MAQEIPGTDEKALDYVISGDEKLVEIQKAISDAESNGEYDSLNSQLEDLDGFTAKSRAEKLLVGLGFSEEEFKNS